MRARSASGARGRGEATARVGAWDTLGAVAVAAMVALAWVAAMAPGVATGEGAAPGAAGAPWQGSPAGAAGGAAEAGALRFPVRLTDCANIEIGMSLPWERVAPFVPADFSVPSTAGLLAPVYLGIATCEATTPDARGTASFVWTDVGVTPLDDRLRVGAGTTYLYRVENLLVDDLYLALNRQVGAPHTVLDAIRVTIAPLEGTHAEARGPGFLHTLTEPTGLPLFPGGGNGVSFREYQAAPGGYAYLEGTYTSGDPAGRGPALFQPSPGSVAEAMVGGPAWGQMAIFGEGYHFGDAAVGFLPFP